MFRASVFNPGTPLVCKVTESTRILDGSPPNTDPGPKWRYDLRPVGLKYDATTYTAGDVTAYAPTPLEATTLTGYNVSELENTPTTWFGLPSTTYQGLEFEPAPGGAIVLAFMVPFEMVDGAGAYATGSPDHVALFLWANQLSGTCG